MGLVASAVGRNYRSIAALHDTLEELFLRSHKDFSGTLAHFIALRRLEIEGALGLGAANFWWPTSKGQAQSRAQARVRLKLGSASGSG